MNKPYSKNDRAEKLLGRRLEGNPIDFPSELGYECPICKIAEDSGLEWSEYQGFLWCERCDGDYPTPLCVPLNSRENVDRATDVFLDIVERAHS
jgi:hypothetical protein